MGDIVLSAGNVERVADETEAQPEPSREVVFQVRDATVHYGNHLAVADVGVDVGRA